jgi:hypothetical protein
MKLQQKSLDQTGVAILEFKDGKREIPLFSCNPVAEINSIIENYFSDCISLKAVYITNNLMETKIEDIIEKYRYKHPCLPENYMNELLSGFPYIIGNEEETLYFYA